ncbi:hypothetical protein GCM10010124_01520 [Pilimelia terevasa]|uniref:Uncharacterized protein n=1 Tax=Pilimelia terevasa TaxID=53372 RepID=A0A8J3FDT2_9ACTN|nr:hypothetical protein GCM10010124_01520 [Pilimelia terevasa]
MLPVVPGPGRGDPGRYGAVAYEARARRSFAFRDGRTPAVGVGLADARGRMPGS